MSANPLALEHLRHRGFAYMRRHGKSPAADGFRTHMRGQLATWRRETPGSHELSEWEGLTLVESVMKWCCANYRPKKLPTGAADRRACRTDVILSRETEILREGGKASCRRIARRAKSSRMTTWRTLKQHRARTEARRRLESLSRKATTVLDLIGGLKPNHLALYDLDQVSSVMTPGDVSDKPSARSRRRKRVEDAFDELAAAGVMTLQVRRRKGLLAVATTTAALTEDDWSSVFESKPVAVRPEDIQPERVFGPVFADAQAHSVMSLVRLVDGEATSTDVRNAVLTYGKCLNPHALIDTIRKANRIENVNLPVYISGAIGMRRLDPHDAKAFGKFAELLASAKWILFEENSGTQLLELLQHNGHLDPGWEFYTQIQKRRLEFVVYAMRMPFGTANLVALADMERRRQWRFCAARDDASNWPSDEKWVASGYRDFAGQEPPAAEETAPETAPEPEPAVEIPTRRAGLALRVRAAAQAIDETPAERSRRIAAELRDYYERKKAEEEKASKLEAFRLQQRRKLPLRDQVIWGRMMDGTPIPPEAMAYFRSLDKDWRFG